MVEKTSLKRRRKGLVSIEIEKGKQDVIKNVSSESDSDYIIIVQRKSK